MKNIAVILSGCGYLDGAEIRESVLTLLALDTEKVNYSIYALNKDQHHTVNHLEGKEISGVSRNILEESARIARGAIADIIQLNEKDFDALIIPGGFGVAKNMCSFAFDGSGASVDELVATKVKDFKNAEKPIGAVCIAPALIALSIGDSHPTLTIGSDEQTATELEKLGAKHHTCDTSDCVVDESNKIVTTPAYMDNDANLADVYSGISKLVKNVIALS
ncbi:isoprenoid biosynthesis glyoxalase ElbB [Marinibactrum halimedae]|uniref:Glyoxalase n=1 Tax=Marinibactrum halimedae TaxID=1444977 RepID=A0AA37T3T9_9GAMM|nr:isoprenoid biosynthesis glyoxalase ElbB [Marinibactrum halimedae]MCD9460152.1 isoprenoid biosynthesis glyoxalase ElbB [Marinibactrum halimedae]GLS26378.1 glyoxalase [Marinibactrum halimedae]